MRQTVQIPITQKNDIKIFILYLMVSVGYPLTFTEISDISVIDGFVRYFDFADCFTELLDMGHIVEVAGTPETMYTVSGTGRQVAEELQTNLSIAIRDISKKSAVRHLSFSRRGASLSCSYNELENGKFTIHCEIAEHGKNVMEVTVNVDSKREVDAMMSNFRRRPEIIYKGVLALLSGDMNYIFEP